MFAPMAIFAFWLKPAPGFLTLASACIALAVILREPGKAAVFDESVSFARLALAILAAATILVLGGELHLFHGVLDWRQRDAVLWDLVRDGVGGGYAFESRDYVMRAPFAMYMLPMLVGKATGLMGAHVALLAQNATLLGMVFCIFARIGGGSWLRVAVMIFYGGLSLVGFAMLTGFTEIQRQQFVYRFGLDAWHPYLQFTSTMNQFFWVPNHTIPGWWLTALAIMRARGQIDSATVAAGVVGVLFWSPLVIVPVVLWLAFFALRDLKAHLNSRRLWAAALAGACAIPEAIYLTIGADTIHSGIPTDLFMFWPLYALFVCVQLCPAIYVFANRDKLSPGDVTLWFMATPLLLVLPLVSFGPANDLLQRGAIPSLAIIAFLLGGLVTRPGAIRTAWGALGWAIVVVSSASALWAIWCAVSRPPFEISDCTLVEAHDALGGHKRGVPTNYAVPVERMPRWLLNMEGFKPAPLRWRPCWSDIDERLNPLEPVQK